MGSDIKSAYVLTAAADDNSPMVTANMLSSRFLAPSPVTSDYCSRPSYDSLFPNSMSGHDIPSIEVSPGEEYDELPSYSTGVSVQRQKTKHAPLLSLEIDKSSREGYFYQTGGVISGSVSVNAYTDLPIECVFIDLQMIETVKRYAGHHPATRFINKTIVAHFTPPFTAYPPNMTLEKDMSYKFDFSLQIPETRPLPACKSGLHEQLPSSLGSLPEFGGYHPAFGKKVDVSDSAATVRYLVRARLLQTPTRVMSQQISHVWIMPYNSQSVGFDPRRQSVSSFGSIAPSLSSNSSASSINEDNVVQASKTIVSGFLRKVAIGTCTIEVEKPNAFDIFSNSPTMLTTKLFFKSEPTVKPPHIKSITVKALLFTKVFSPSSDGVGASEDREAVHTTTDTVILKKLEVSSQSSWQILEKDSYFSSVQVPVSIPERDFRFVPSFKSCLVERSYALSVSASFDSGSTVEVCTPVELGCKRRRGNRGLYKITSKGYNRRYSTSLLEGGDGNVVDNDMFDEFGEVPMYSLH
ncbi:hypothetical protein AWJ20_4335 [Sugiyamaella lignohabitans]|uniref:Arrestin-like N-terminal domain-containing protein n=1 Tax=Sugiyamaella lignohabitans TaxID=796027 RepID=A0A161HJD5_9ASCO|nr:uncharacterized protein AWJ20_4335 [Sugiyamaella lignohabitans]ANB11518.1 hypothetical protein AWJ20_4335 [Sugiyamaella lignohabitans]